MIGYISLILLMIAIIMGIYQTIKPAITTFSTRKERPQLITSLRQNFTNGRYHMLNIERRYWKVIYESPKFEYNVKSSAFVHALEGFDLFEHGVQKFEHTSWKTLCFIDAIRTACHASHNELDELCLKYPKHAEAFRGLHKSTQKLYTVGKAQRYKYYETLEVEKKRQEQMASEKAAKTDLGLHYKNCTELLTFLKSHGPDPDFWHSIICEIDPDNRGATELFHWIASHPQCDAGTAAQIFNYGLNPYEALKIDPKHYPLTREDTMRHINYNTAKLIADRFTANNYISHRFTLIDMACTTTENEYKRLVATAIQKFGQPAFQLSAPLFDYSERTMPKTQLYYSHFG